MLLVRGDGPSFSAGLDRRLLTGEGIEGATRPLAIAEMSAEQASDEIAGYQRGFAAFARPNLISIAAVQGHAVGAGFQLALACDLRVAAADAQFTMAEVQLGLVPDLGGTKRLIELVGYSRASAICLTGRRVSAAEALQLGLVNEVVPLPELAAAAERWIADIMARPAGAVTEIKALLLAAADRGQAEQELAERAAQHRQLRSLVGIEDER